MPAGLEKNASPLDRSVWVPQFLSRYAWPRVALPPWLCAVAKMLLMKKRQQFEEFALRAVANDSNTTGFSKSLEIIDALSDRLSDWRRAVGEGEEVWSSCP